MTEDHWTEDERQDFLMHRSEGIFAPYRTHDIKPRCYRGIWHTERFPEDDEKLTKELNINRGNSCFYFRYQEGMDFETAYDLWKIRNENRNLRNSQMATVIGLLIAGLALIANVVVQVWW